MATMLSTSPGLALEAAAPGSWFGGDAHPDAQSVDRRAPLLGRRRFRPHAAAAGGAHVPAPRAAQATRVTAVGRYQRCINPGRANRFQRVSRCQSRDGIRPAH